MKKETAQCRRIALDSMTNTAYLHSKQFMQQFLGTSKTLATSLTDPTKYIYQAIVPRQSVRLHFGFY